MYRLYIKRLLDIIVSLVCLPFFVIILLFVAPLIKLEDGGTIFYKAKRRGIYGCIFEMYKFRSMKMNAPDIRNNDNSTFNSESDPRVTKIGRILRKMSLDETPQILNVLKGDMSIIGPRPVTVDKTLEELDEVRKKRLKVRPGITGYSQAYYRNSISQELKLKYDAEYAESVSFKKDFMILLKTISTVFRAKNIYGK